MTECSTVAPETLPHRILLRCPHCGARLVLKDLQPGAQLFDPTLHALIDHLLLVEDQLTEIKRLVEEVLP